MSIEDHIKTEFTSTRPRPNAVYPIFSEEDSDLASVKWRNVDGYAVRTIRFRVDGIVKYKSVMAHRIVMTRMIGRELSRHDITDHFNRNRLDCTRQNLKIVSYMQNSQNTKLSKKNSSGFKNVFYRKNRGNWIVRVRNGKAIICGGTYNTAEEANEAAIAIRKRLGFHDSSLT